jgi:hypothetical protein
MKLVSLYEKQIMKGKITEPDVYFNARVALTHLFVYQHVRKPFNLLNSSPCWLSLSIACDSALVNMHQPSFM